MAKYKIGKNMIRIIKVKKKRKGLMAKLFGEEFIVNQYMCTICKRMYDNKDDAFWCYATHATHVDKENREKIFEWLMAKSGGYWGGL